MRKDRSLRRALITGFGALVLFGSWAFYINSGNGWEQRLLSTASQGLFSFTGTFITTLLIELLFRLGGRGSQGALAGFVGGPVIILSAMALGHYLVGTPRILHTLLPSMISGVLFAGTYVIVLMRMDQQTEIDTRP